MGVDARKNRRTKVPSTVVRYRSATLAGFVESHSRDVSNGGTFIETPSPLPPGTLLNFELKFETDPLTMHGVARVVWRREQDEESTGKKAGMAVKFVKIDSASRAVITRLVEKPLREIFR